LSISTYTTMPRKKSEDNTPKIDNTSGPNLYTRDENGLLKNVQYVFGDDGSVNWRAMVGDEHLFPNKSWFELRNKDCPRTSEGLADHQLLIKLGGIKELAKLRGFSDVYYDIVKCEEDHVAVKCSITFTPNYETGNEPIVFSDMANATHANTSSFATKFLETIACNRAFVRCVRNFLNVHIVGDDEIDKSSPGQTITKQSSPKNASAVFSPAEMLKKKCSESLNCNDFETFKTHLRTWWQEKKDGVYGNPEIKVWSDWSDISAKDARVLLSIIS